MSDPRPPSPSAPAAQTDATPRPSTQLPPPAILENALHARIDAFSPLCPSAHDVDVDDGEVDQEQAGPGEEPIPQTPQVSLTFLLVTGRRRTMSFEPETTIGRVKELVWNAWPNDWQDERPPAPSYLRILYLGKILQDEDSLDKLQFPTQLPSSAPSSTIVHLSIRAYVPPSDDVPKKKRRSAAVTSAGEGAEEQSAGCCSSCIIC